MDLMGLRTRKPRGAVGWQRKKRTADHRHFCSSNAPVDFGPHASVGWHFHTHRYTSPNAARGRVTRTKILAVFFFFSFRFIASRLYANSAQLNCWQLFMHHHLLHLCGGGSRICNIFYRCPCLIPASSSSVFNLSALF